MRTTFTLLLVAAAIALGACRREEPVAPAPMKLGASVEQPAR